MSSKNFVCVFVAFLSVAFGEKHADGIITMDEGVTGNCSCGGFPTTTPDANSSPLLSQSPGLIVNCNEEGETTCKSLCLALATAAKAKGPEILCNRLKDANELKLSAFYKACDKPWIFADMTAEEPLCCENSSVKPCADGGSTTVIVGI